MRLRRLYVREYRVLWDLEIRFGPLDGDARGAPIDVPTYTLDFVVGVNGSGKSTVLRALGEIYRHLYGSSSFADFTFEIEYELSFAGPIMISNFDPESKERISGFRFRVGEEGRRVDEIEDQYLPPKVIAFTTRSEAEWFLSQETSTPDGPPAVREKLEQKDRAVLELPGRTMNEEGLKGPSLILHVGTGSPAGGLTGGLALQPPQSVVVIAFPRAELEAFTAQKAGGTLIVSRRI